MLFDVFSKRIEPNYLYRLAGFDNLGSFQAAHKQWVQSAIEKERLDRKNQWTQSIATGGRSFIEAVKNQMGSLVIGRKVRQEADRFEIRESPLPYNCLFDVKKSNIGAQNRYFWNG